MTDVEQEGTREPDDVRSLVREEIQAAIEGLVVPRISENEARLDGLSITLSTIEQPLLDEIRRLRQCLSVIVGIGQEGLVGAE